METKESGAPAENTAEPASTKISFVIYGMKNFQKVRITGDFVGPDLDSLKATFTLLAMRDSRIMEIYVSDPATGKVLWGLQPGTLRTMLDQNGFGPDMIQREPGGGGPGGRIRR